MTQTRRFVIGATLAAMCILCGCARPTPVTVVPAIPAVTTNVGCLLKTHQSDGSVYVTSQKQELSSAEDYIRVYGTEPEGNYDWQLNRGMVTLKGAESSMKWLPQELSPLDYCRILLASMAASPANQAAAATPVRVLGNWATPVASADGLTWYRSAQNLRSADIVVMPGPDATQIVARTNGSISKAGQPVPSKLEIYLTSESTADRLLLELDYIE
jgi:hypothetical protein